MFNSFNINYFFINSLTNLNHSEETLNFFSHKKRSSFHGYPLIISANLVNKETLSGNGKLCSLFSTFSEVSITCLNSFSANFSANFSSNQRRFIHSLYSNSSNLFLANLISSTAGISSGIVHHNSCIVCLIFCPTSK